MIELLLTATGAMLLQSYYGKGRPLSMLGVRREKKLEDYERENWDEMYEFEDGQPERDADTDDEEQEEDVTDTLPQDDDFNQRRGVDLPMDREWSRGRNPSAKNPYGVSAVDTERIQEMRLQNPRGVIAPDLRAGQNLRPLWLRTLGEPMPKRTVVERDFNKDWSGDQVDIQQKLQQHLQRGSLSTLNKPFGKGGLPFDDQERVRPPKAGGPEGYDEERGKAPIPRYHKFNLGLDRTGQVLPNDGRVPGFAAGEAAKAQLQRTEGWEIAPDRGLQLCPASASNLRLAGLRGNSVGAFVGCTKTPYASKPTLEWDRGPTGGRAGVLAPPVAPQDDINGERRYRHEDLDTLRAREGAHASLLTPGTAFRQIDVVPEGPRHVPESTREESLRVGQGVAMGAAVPGTDARTLRTTAGPSLRPLDTLKPSSGQGRGVDALKGNTARVPDTIAWKFSYNLQSARAFAPGTPVPTRPAAEQSMASIRGTVVEDNVPVPLYTRDFGTLAKARKPTATPVVAKTGRLQGTRTALARLDLGTAAGTETVARRTTVPERRVLFTEEQRNEYKTDTLPDMTGRGDLDQRMTTAQGGRGKVDTATTRHAPQASVAQQGFRTTHPVNSDLRRGTADAPRPSAIGIVTQTAPSMGIVADGVRRTALPPTPRLIATPALTHHATNVGHTSTNPPISDMVPLESTRRIGTQIKDVTSLAASTHSTNAAKSHPVRYSGLASLNAAQSGSHDRQEDHITERAGSIVGPLAVPQRPAGPAPLQMGVSTLREAGEFRRR